MPKVSIELTSNAEDYEFCARMMSVTDPWRRLDMDYSQCLKAFDGDFKEIFVLKKDEVIKGFVIVQTQGSFKGYIQTLCIESGGRGEGYGTRLLQFCEDRILTYSPNIFICVSSFNEGAIRLYLRFGFELVGELRNFVKEGFTELLLRKTVGPVIGYQCKH